MKTSHLLLTLYAFISFIACKDMDPNKHVDEGVVKEDTYFSKEIGWTMNLPKGWDVVERDKQKDLQEKGLNAIQDANDIVVDMSSLKNLISFKKDQFNLFLSTSEQYELAYEGEWEDNHEAVKEFITTTYVKNGIDYDITPTSTENIDGLAFKTFSIKLYDPNGKVLLNQVMYGRYINGFDFSVCINYNNDADRDEMLEVFKNSKFRREKS